MNFLNFYKHVMHWGEPIWYRFFQSRLAKSKEIPDRIFERWGQTHAKRPEEAFVIWIHGASIGEGMMALSLLNAAPCFEWPRPLLGLVTTGTASSATILPSRLPSWAMHQLLPIDTPRAVGDFLKHWRPDVSLILESEWWPVLLNLTLEAGIPCWGVNVRVSEQRKKWWPWMAPLLRSSLRQMGWIVPSRIHKEKLHSLGVEERIFILPNLKWSIAPQQVNEEAFQAFKERLNKRPVLLSASTHPGEEDLLYPVYSKLKEHIPHLLWIVAPRHPVRIPEILDAPGFKKANIGMRSVHEYPEAQQDIFFVDTFGELGLFYKLSQAVILGGSFVPGIGGHNPVEALHCKVPVIFGPYTHNNQDLAETTVAAGACLKVSQAQEAFPFLLDWLQNPETAREIISKADQLLHTNAHVNHQVWELIRAQSILGGAAHTAL